MVLVVLIAPSAVAVLAFAGLGASGQAGASAVARSGGFGALRYVADARELPSNDDPHPLSVPCPEGMQVVGGGTAASGHDLDIELAVTVPTDKGDPDLKPDDGWFGNATNSSGAQEVMVVTAICKSPGDLRYVQQTQDLPDQSIHGAFAKCPHGTQVISGGVHVSGANRKLEIAASEPHDAPGDPGSKPDNGWFGRATNDSGTDESFSVHAICAETGRFVYLSASQNVSDNAHSESSVLCPPRAKVTGGGVDLTLPGPDDQPSNIFGIEAAGSTSVDGPDKNKLRDDGWRGAVNNDNTGAGETMTTFAICTKPSERHFSGTFSGGGTMSFVLTHDGTKVHSWTWNHMPIQCSEGSDANSSSYKRDVEVNHSTFHGQETNSTEGFKTTLDGKLSHGNTKAEGTLTFNGNDPPNHRCHGTGHWSANAH